MNDNYLTLKLGAGALATFGLYSVLWRESRFYRFFEHVFLGLAAGFSLKALWTETLSSLWWDPMMGKAADGGSPATPGYWLWAILLPIGFMAYFVFSRKHNWISRVPIGVILGFWSGQQVMIWWQRYGGQIEDSIRPVVPTTFGSFATPNMASLSGEAAAEAARQLYPAQAISNIIFIVTLLAVLSYFLFSFELKSKFMRSLTNSGRILLMVGFGAIFGSTVMTRFTLLIDRMYFVFIEFFQQQVFK